MMPKSMTAIEPSERTNIFPGCRSAWKKPSRKTCLKNDRGGASQNLVGVVAGSDERVPAVDSDAGHPFGGQDPLAGSRPVDAGDMESGVAFEIPRQFRSGGGFEPQVHFQDDRLRQDPNRFERPESAKFGPCRLENRRRPKEQIEIPVERGFDSGPQYLDRDFRVPRW